MKRPIEVIAFRKSINWTIVNKKIRHFLTCKEKMKRAGD